MAEDATARLTVERFEDGDARHSKDCGNCFVFCTSVSAASHDNAAKAGRNKWRDTFQGCE